jgi:hypothetical protein
MTNTATKNYYVGVIERTIAYYDVKAATAMEAAENWGEGDFSDRDDEALDTEGPCSVREQQPDGTWREVPPSEWEAAPPPGSDSVEKSYSVLLLYPDYLDDRGYETYYAFIEAADAIEAIAVAQRQAIAAQSVEIDDPNDFHPLLVTQGHHHSEPLFNK